MMIRILITLSFLTYTLIGNTQVMDTVSYSIGVVLAENLKAQGMTDINVNVVSEALNAHLKDDAKISIDDAAQIYGEAMQKAQANKHAANKEAGEQFLMENGKRSDVVTLPSGLQYEVMKEGDGPKPTAQDKVNVHYHGTLINGQVFDSSVERGEPISFPLSGVIKGWTEGLQYMSVGSKYKLFIPYDLAYGDRGAGQTIKPYSALVFEVELLGIE